MEIKKPTRQLWGSNPKGWDFVRVSPLRRGSSEGLTAALTRRFYFALIDHDSLFTGWSMPCGAVHMVPDPICNIGIASGTTAYVWVMDLGGTLPIKPISECLPHCSDERPVHGHLTKGKPKVKQQVQDEYSNGDEEEEDVVEYRKKQKHRNKDSVLQKLIFHLLIPAVNPEDPIEWHSLDTQSSFEQFKNLVYKKTLSCEKVHIKPSLSYKMPGATVMPYPEFSLTPSSPRAPVTPPTTSSVY
ncbi:hypothetical protein F5879DRAFT_1002673 [Lentinula edodes]|nr:hypothetical protein F5879DRAFT_1002673 [Lentinula edodes]